MIADSDFLKDLPVSAAAGPLKFVAVEAKDLPLVWGHVLPAVQKYPELWEPFNTEETLFFEFYNGNAKLWLVIQDNEIMLMLGTQVVVSPMCKNLNVFWGVGQGMNEWMPLVCSGLEEYARKQGYQHVLLEGRLGWKPIIERQGYKLLSARFIKSVVVPERMN